MTGWRAKLDQCIMAAGMIVASAGFLAQVAGFALTFLFDMPIEGEVWLVRGTWLAGFGGAGLYYGIKVDTGGSMRYPGGPVTYEPPARRWPIALIAIGLTPLWGVLSLPIGIMFYGVLLIAGPVYGVMWLVQRLRRAASRA
jgi:hypothetical protein